VARDAVAPFRLETPRLVLRHLTNRDLAAHLAMRADPLTRRYQGFPRRYGALEALAFFAWMQARDPAAGGGWFNLCIAERADDRHAGDVALKAADGVAMLGVTLERRVRGRGYATEALGALMTWLAARGIARFTAEVDARNAASIALVERRLGFAFQDSYPDGGVTLNRYARPAG
jgi:RimJ/RimL family protein N-acetyltransferase